jgi:penicillin amidase
LNRALYADELGPLFDRYWGLRPEVVAHILANRPLWCDDVTTSAAESCNERIALALDRATATLAAEYGEDMDRWRWGDAHRATFTHRVFDAVPGLDGIANLSLDADGGAFTVNRNASNIRDPKTPYAAIHGAGYRAVYDLADLSKSLFSQATGQSGHPLSPFYDSFTESWRDFRYLTITGDRESLARSGLGVLTLVPRQ